MVDNWHEPCTRVERLNTDFAAVSDKVSGRVAFQFEIRVAQDSSCPFNARRASGCAHTRATGHHLLHVSQLMSRAQAKLGHQKSSSRAFGSTLLDAWDTVTKLLIMLVLTRICLDSLACAAG